MPKLVLKIVVGDFYVKFKLILQNVVINYYFNFKKYKIIVINYGFNEYLLVLF